MRLENLAKARFSKHRVGSTGSSAGQGSTPVDSTAKRDHRVPISEADPKSPQGPGPASQEVEGNRQVGQGPSDAKGNDRDPPKAESEATPGRATSVPPGTSSSRLPKGFDPDLRGWVRGRAAAWHSIENPAQVFRTAAVGGNEAPGNVARTGVKPVEGQRAAGVRSRPGIASQFSPSDGARNAQIPQDRSWILNASTGLAARVERGHSDATGDVSRTPAESSSSQLPRSVSGFGHHDDGLDAVARQPQQARVTEGSSSLASRSSSAARSNDPGPEGIHPSRGTRDPGSEAGRGAARTDEIGRPSREADDLLRPLTRYTQSTLPRPVDTGLLLRGLDRFSGPVGLQAQASQWGREAGGQPSKPEIGPDAQPKGDTVQPEANSDRPAARPSSAVAERVVGQEQLPSVESRLETGSESGAKTGSKRDEIVESPPRALPDVSAKRASASDRGTLRVQTTPSSNQAPPAEGAGSPRNNTGTAETRTQTEQLRRSGEGSLLQSRPDDTTRQRAEGSPKEASPSEHRPVRMDWDSSNRSPAVRGVKVPLPPEQLRRSGEGSLLQSRPDDTTRQRAEGSPKGDSPSEHRPVRMDWDSSSRSPAVRGVKVPLPPEQLRRSGEGSLLQSRPDDTTRQRAEGSPKEASPSEHRPVRMDWDSSNRSPAVRGVKVPLPPEQLRRSGEDSLLQSRPDDRARKRAEGSPKEDSPSELRPVRTDWDSSSRSPAVRGVKVPLPSLAATVQSESPVGRRPLNWVREMGGSTLDAEKESSELGMIPKKVQEVATQAVRMPARTQAEPIRISALEDRILREGLEPRRTLPDSQSNPVRFQPSKSESDLLNGRGQPEVQVSRVFEQSGPVLDQNSRSTVPAWPRAPVVVEKDLRGENRGRQQNSLPVQGALGQTAHPVLRNPEPVSWIQGREELPPGPEEPEAKPGTEEQKKTFSATQQEDSERPVLVRHRSSQNRDSSSDKVWGEAGEKLGVVEARRPGGRGEVTLSTRATSLDARDSAQALQLAYSSSSRSSLGSELSQQGTPAWLKSPTAFVDAVASQFVQHSRFLKGGETVRFEIQLNPEFLGKIRIKTSLNQQNKLAVEIEVDDPEVRELLEQRLPALVEKLQGMGVEPDRLKVDGFSSHSQSDAQQQEGQRREQSAGSKSWSGPNRDESEEDSPDRSEVEDLEGIHYFA